MANLKLVAAPAAAPAGETGAALGPDDTARLLADLERTWSGADRELGARAAKCIRELVQQKEQATALMLESSALLRTALDRLHTLRTDLEPASGNPSKMSEKLPAGHSF